MMACTASSEVSGTISLTRGQTNGMVKPNLKPTPVFWWCKTAGRDIEGSPDPKIRSVAGDVQEILQAVRN
jgi:hypothetical protein